MRLHIIPVIDLKGGEVVRAERGERHLYAPIKTPLAPTSRPADIIAGFLALYPFRTIYVADLDAIEGRGPHDLAEIEAAFPDLTFWVDAGVGTSAEAKSWHAEHRGELVLGSESLHDSRLVASLATLPRSLLSLDFRGEDFQGPAQLLDPSLWPKRLIAMTLARVGSGAGPDLDRLREIRKKAEDRALYAAGGVRDVKDLEALEGAGIAGVLVASALHDGRITMQNLAAYE
ncbi:MAG TPA: HisA/HisF-related TIM barrel protein [Methylovirgula sp.]|nr:HisA/HisF-related TIM barrel protein [Methylovirgula sp.]